MLSRVSESKVIADTVSVRAINDYENLSSALTGVIENSFPCFTIGIYGEWGTGKTTLMNMVKNKLEKTPETDLPKILPIWFDAWRYAGEKQLAVIAILRTIAHKIKEYPEADDTFCRIKKFLAGASITSFDILSHMIGMGMSAKMIQENFSESKPTSDEEESTIYFDLLNEIKNAMEKIRIKNKEFRMVVFVDDLDRCSPLKALQVLESIKTFFNIPGFIYVLGISHETLSNLIDQIYKDSKVEGREYIKKIIQVPITLPSWEIEHMEELLEEEINKLNPKHTDALKGRDTRNYILKVADNNPRQLKRLINSFIVTYDTYSGDDLLLDGSILFNCLSIQKNKPKLFSAFIEDEFFRENITDFIKEMDKMDDLTYTNFREPKSETITPSNLSILSLVIKIKDARGNEIKDDDARDDEIKNNERRKEIQTAFRNFINDKYAPESNKSEKSEDSNLDERRSERRKARMRFSKVVKSNELIKMSMSDWLSLNRGLVGIVDSKNLSKYKDAINMMREDLKMDTDSRNLNKN